MQIDQRRFAGSHLRSHPELNVTFVVSREVRKDCICSKQIYYYKGKALNKHNDTGIPQPLQMNVAPLPSVQRLEMLLQRR